MTLFQKLKNRFSKTQLLSQPEIHTRPEFDPKYKVVVRCDAGPTYLEMLEWVNKNSAGSVDVKFDIGFGYGVEAVYLGFEDTDDALIFKIKYSV